MALFSFSKKILGIDIGSVNTKIVEVVKNKNDFEVVNFGIIPIVNFKEIVSYSYILEENLAAIISEFLKKAKVSTREVIFNVPAPYAFVVNFFVPEIPEKSIPQVVKFEAQKQIPLSIEEVDIDYRYVKFENENQVNQWLVCLVATPKDYIKKIQTISYLSKLKFVGYSPEYFNFETYFVNKGGSYVVVDLGHAYSLLCLIKDQKLIYATKLRVRGYDFLDSVIRVTGLNEEGALDLLYKKGFYFLPEERELYGLANNFLDNLSRTILEEVQKLENSFFLKVDKVYWTGGLSILTGFKEAMFKRFNRHKQEILTPFEIFKGSKFQNLGEKSTIFLHSLGIIYNKI
jgi:type IV pilus assembly protein PilM